MKVDAVLLSASLPDPNRDPSYFRSADLTAIRDATRALATVVLPHSNLVFGGHPAVSPLVRAIAERLGRTDSVKIYQSAYFIAEFPKDNAAFSDCVVVPEVPGDREASLATMRLRMMTESRFTAAVFLGGMEGVEEEYDLFSELNPGVPTFPVGSTGAAAKRLFDAHVSSFSAAEQHELNAEFAYVPLFRRLLRLP